MTSPAPQYKMVNARPVPIPASEIGLPFDTKEEESAVCDLRNISKSETARRLRLANVGLVLSVLGTAFFMWKRDNVPQSWRLFMLFPYSLGISMFLSSKCGICGISATGMWDPDGKGIRSAPTDVARKIWIKAQKVHVSQILLSLAATGAFYASPL